MASKRLDDGFSTIISFAAAPSVKFYEKDMMPPGIDGGGANDISTMRNTTYRTRAPKKLITLDDASFNASYDPTVYSTILASLINVNTLITITFSDGSTIAFYGWLNHFRPASIREGSQPEASIQIIPSNQNNSQVETAPVITAAA